MLKKGDIAPHFVLPTNKGKEVSLKNFLGKKLVLYFYPKDSTPGCTIQAQNFSNNYNNFKKINSEIVGISKDSIESHNSFCSMNDIYITLASDKDKNVCEQYGVWDEKLLYGKKFFGIKRTTFLIDEKGYIEKIWHAVKVENHAEEILNFISKK